MRLSEAHEAAQHYKAENEQLKKALEQLSQVVMKSPEDIERCHKVLLRWGFIHAKEEDIISVCPHGAFHFTRCRQCAKLHCVHWNKKGECRIC